MVHLIPIITSILKPGDDLAAILKTQGTINDGDILVISSKAIATVEGAAIDLSKMKPSKEAQQWWEQTGKSRTPSFYEAAIQEVKRLNGTIVSACAGAVLTEVKPEGLARGTILTANAGLDESNIAENFAIGWPKNPVKSIHDLRHQLATRNSQPATRNLQSIGIILSDSCCRPRRFGVTAFALAVSGIDPLQSELGKNDLFGKPLRITTEAIADQLATAANFIMGNAGQSIPAVIVRDHGIPFSDYEGWVNGIDQEEDLFG